jgi:CheY-like chemotaxis protein
VFMSAYVADEHLAAAAETKAFAVMHKPVPPPRLLDVVARAMAA